MKRWMILVLSLFVAPNAVSADLTKARQEGRVNLYTNITAIGQHDGKVPCMGEL